MRWTDLPPDSGPADGRASALPRGEWEALRRRLERLPEGHPSRPDDGPDATAVEELADIDVADSDLEGEGGGVPAPLEAADTGQANSWDGKDPERRVRGPGSADASRGKATGLGDLGGHGEREPYRPWFTEGESPEPWFTVEPG